MYSSNKVPSAHEASHYITHVLATLIDDADDHVMQKLNGALTHDGGEVAVANTGVIGEKNVSATCHDGKRTTEELRLTLSIGGDYGHEADTSGSSTSHGAIKRGVNTIVRWGIKHEKG